jgi:two-component system sensor histidine kinase MprB
VLRPVVTLAETVEYVADSGDLNVRVGPTGADEVGRLAAAFTAMMTNLDQSITAQQRLVADASHELRTPLTSLITNLELLDEGRGTNDPQAPTLVREARAQTAELTALVNDLIDLGRYGQAAAYTEDVRVDLLVADLLARAERRTRGLVYVSELTECVAHVDPDALQRAIGNLLENAVKWSPPTGQIHVRVGLEVTGEPPMVEIVVTDEGPGIDDADLPYVFDRFFRSARDRALLGSGLGLAIVRRVAEAHDGTVVAERGTKGARFRFRVPALLVPAQ